MNWSDEGVILSVRKHGETSAVAHVLTRLHGRHGGLVRGGDGRRHKGVLQPGNEVMVTWRGRLAEHLGTFEVELTKARAAAVLDDPLRLAAMASACALVEVALPEREPHTGLYDALLLVLRALTEEAGDWPALYVRWELGLLAELGFGLDLASCAASGGVADLTHVSPRSARAVSAAAAAPYAARLLRLPSFLAAGRGGLPADDPAEDIRAGLLLTGFFLREHVFGGQRDRMPAARTRLVDRFFALATTSGVKAIPNDD